MTAPPAPQLLLVAKAPVPGVTKTRLAAAIGMVAAAEIAAAALLDTIDTCTASFGADRCHLALTGGLDDAVAGAEIRERLDGWSVREQRGATFADRLVNAHRDLDGARIQIGMDTPQITREHLRATSALLAEHDAVLGPASDGGWWALAARTADVATPLSQVAMSTPTTCRDTRAALIRAGWNVAASVTLRDVDEIDDLEPVVSALTTGRFRTAVLSLRSPLEESA